MLFRLLVILLLFISSVGYGQKKKRSPRNDSQVTSVGPYYPDANKYMPAKKKKSKGGISRESIENSYVQRERVAKQKRRAEKILAGTDFGDTSHFGHRRTPKKNKPGQMKFCKVCGIRH